MRRGPWCLWVLVLLAITTTPSGRVSGRLLTLPQDWKPRGMFGASHPEGPPEGEGPLVEAEAKQVRDDTYRAASSTPCWGGSRAGCRWVQGCGKTLQSAEWHGLDPPTPLCCTTVQKAVRVLSDCLDKGYGIRINLPYHLTCVFMLTCTCTLHDRHTRPTRCSRRSSSFDAFASNG
jgi:hypothetical protein